MFCKFIKPHAELVNTKSINKYKSINIACHIQCYVFKIAILRVYPIYAIHYTCTSLFTRINRENSTL